MVGASLIRVLIVDNQRLFAEVMDSALTALGLCVLPAARTGSEALAAAAADRPELVLVDLGLPDMDGLKLAERILADLPDTKIVAVTALHDTGVVGKAIAMGFAGYVTKDVPLSQFIQAINSVIDGQVVVAHQPLPPTSPPPDPRADLLLSQLTPRERDVLQLLGEGAGGPEIARRLSVSQNTVRTHVQNILTKLQVHTRLEAVAFAVRHGVLVQPVGSMRELIARPFDVGGIRQASHASRQSPR